MRITVLTGVVLGCSAFSWTLTAQEPELPKPGKEHKVLALDAGTWDCELKMFYQGPDGPPTVSKGVEVNKLVSGDMYLQTSFKGEMRGQTFEGHALMGYDPRSKKYTGTWVDNFTAAPQQFEGTYDEKAKKMTLRSVVVGPGGQELTQKQVVTRMGESKKKLEVFLVIEAGGKETDIKLMEMVATKRK